MKVVEIYFDDLTPEAQQKITDEIGYNDNWLYVPIFIIQEEQGEA